MINENEYRVLCKLDKEIAYCYKEFLEKAIRFLSTQPGMTPDDENSTIGFLEISIIYTNIAYMVLQGILGAFDINDSNKAIKILDHAHKEISRLMGEEFMRERAEKIKEFSRDWEKN